MFVYVLSLCVFLSCVSAFCFRCIVCCSMAWVCVVLVRLNVLLKSMCVSFVMYNVILCLSGVFVCVCWCGCECSELNVFVYFVCDLLCDVVWIAVLRCVWLFVCACVFNVVCCVCDAYCDAVLFAFACFMCLWVLVRGVLYVLVRCVCDVLSYVAGNVCV